jgi:uncharacterized membrane protein
MKRFISLVLILLGVLLLYWGYDLQQQLDMALIQRVTGKVPERVWQYYVTGGVALLVGVFGLWRFR